MKTPTTASPSWCCAASDILVYLVFTCTICNCINANFKWISRLPISKFVRVLLQRSFCHRLYVRIPLYCWDPSENEPVVSGSFLDSQAHWELQTFIALTISCQLLQYYQSVLLTGIVILFGDQLKWSPCVLDQYDVSLVVVEVKLNFSESIVVSRTSWCDVYGWLLMTFGSRESVAPMIGALGGNSQFSPKFFGLNPRCLPDSEWES